ncbi:PH domain-containing protein [Caulobacter sp. SLTY]|uniref:PH domain-containing protein n=1 Tax=Caulobacter sp. SLTY TaxID=2683262 RepID=UPI001412A7EB|nr:PH domain-containing protein [Caulobacter sp. SLTY]NBB15613.1 PH domain-containing protein [Caulobacter sp. SLTY]
MGYITSNLAPGESIRAVVKVHWGILFPALSTLVVLAVALGFVQAGVLAAWLAQADISLPVWIPVGVVAIVCVVNVVYALVYLLTTEIAVTDRKVVAKWGLIGRRTIEQRLGKIESVTVDQGLLGRVFDYGSVYVHGTGSGSTPMRYVARPIWVRREIEEAIEAAGGGSD